MREIFIDKNDPYYKKPKAFYILVFSVFVFGCLFAYLFIPPERKIVEVPVEKIKYVDRVVEVPVEKVKYVDRVVEKRVEVPIEKKVEVPVQKKVDMAVENDLYRYQDQNSNLQYKIHWKYLKRGMSRDEVKCLLGVPDSSKRYSSDNLEYWYYGINPDDRAVVFRLDSNRGVVNWFIRN